jgi:hypothetical protein
VKRCQSRPTVRGIRRQPVRADGLLYQNGLLDIATCGRAENAPCAAAGAHSNRRNIGLGQTAKPTSAAPPRSRGTWSTPATPHTRLRLGNAQPAFNRCVPAKGQDSLPYAACSMACSGGAVAAARSVRAGRRTLKLYFVVMCYFQQGFPDRSLNRVRRAVPLAVEGHRDPARG